MVRRRPPSSTHFNRTVTGPDLSFQRLRRVPVAEPARYALICARAARLQAPDLVEMRRLRRCKAAESVLGGKAAR